MFYTTLAFSEGSLFIAGSSKGLSMVKYLKNPDETENTIGFLEEKSIDIKSDENKFPEEKRLFDRYFRGENADFSSLSLDLISGTAYQRKIWDETRKILYRKIETYNSIDLKLNPNAYRSVGGTLNKQPILLVISCHRVIGSNGRLVGFGCGLDLKKYLLKLENENINIKI